MVRKKYDKAFKLAAVKLVLDEEIAVATVSKELGIHYNSLYRWISEYEQYGDAAFPGHGTALQTTQRKMKQLEKENQALREEVELLKRFRVFLKKKNP